MGDDKGFRHVGAIGLALDDTLDDGGEVGAAIGEEDICLSGKPKIDVAANDSDTAQLSQEDPKTARILNKLP